MTKNSYRSITLDFFKTSQIYTSTSWWQKVQESQSIIPQHSANRLKYLAKLPVPVSAESNGTITLPWLPLPAVRLSEMGTFVKLKYNLLKCTWEKQANYTCTAAHLLARWMNLLKVYSPYFLFPISQLFVNIFP